MHRFNKKNIVSAALAVATILTGTAFAQTSTTGGMSAGSTMSTQDMNTAQPMNDVDATNLNSRSPATPDMRGNSYDSTRPADRSTSSGMSGTSGNNAAGNTRYGSTSNDRLNGSGHYADTARGSQLDANDVHATPQPGAMNNNLFRGN